METITVIVEGKTRKVRAISNYQRLTTALAQILLGNGSRGTRFQCYLCPKT